MKVLKIKDIVRTISITHKFDKDKLIAINTSDVENGIMHDGTLTAIEDLKGQFKKTVQKGDILFSEIRPANRRFALVTKDDCADYVVSTKLMVLRKYNNEVDLRYFYYCLTNQPFLDMLQRKAENRIGSFPQITFDLLSEYAFPVPSLSEQEKIANIIFSLDHKIELNKQINDNLETMAKQLYDYWFVQFDFPNEEGKPYKSSGGAMVWNENLKCEIPQGWVVEKMGKCTNVLLGGTPDTNDNSLWGNGYNWLNSGEVAEFPILKSEKNITPKGLEKSATVLAPKGSVTLSITRHLRPSILCIDACINQSVVAILENDKVSKEYIYPLLNRDIPRLMSLRTGAQQPHINKETVEAINVVLPPANIMGAYINIAESIYNAIFNNAKEVEELTKQRDELLPLLMNGQASVNYHLSASFLSSLILYRDQYKFYDMKETIIQTVLDGMRAVLTENQLDLLTDVTRKALSECEITPKATEEEQRNKENVELLGAFISSKKVEGCSDKTIHYYKSSIEKLIATVKKNVCDIATNDIRCYLADQQEQRGLSKVTIDNLRRIYSSFFSWLEDEDYITKSPVRRIHKVRTDALVKEVLTDENIEVLRDSCHELRDIAMIDLLLSTGMRVGELVKINRDDIDFQERQCVVFGKGNKEREVYFNARTKIHLKKYLEQRTDTNPALFVSLHEPHTRLTISGVEVRLRQLGKRVNLNKVHPHKFRRTLATMAIDKGMPIEQVQKMLGHVKIDTTLHYAMVNQTNVKIAHRKFLN